MTIRVFIVEDDPMVEKINQSYVNRVDGFAVVGSARTLAEARPAIWKLEPELVLLDIYLPDESGLQLLRDIRQSDLKTDVIVITAAQDTATISRAIRYGAFDYLLKPFDFPRLRQALENYRSVQNTFDQRPVLTQAEIDALKNATSLQGEAPASNAANNPPGLPANQHLTPEPLGRESLLGLGPHLLPKNIDPLTLQKTESVLNSSAQPLSAEEVGRSLGVTRITARRYLEYLVSIGKVEVTLFYGTVGRPLRRYQMRRERLLKENRE